MKNFYRIKNTDIEQLGDLESHGAVLIEKENLYSLVCMSAESADALVAIGCPVVRC